VTVIEIPMKKILDRRKGVYGLFLWLILGSIILIIISIRVEKYDVTAGSLAVIASLITAAFAYEVIYRDTLNRLLVILIEFDSTSRYGFWQLVIKNVGGSTAYNIRIEWLESLPDGTEKFVKPKNRDNNTISLHPIENYNRIVSLPQGSSTSIWIDEFHAFFNNNQPAEFCVRIIYKDGIKDKNEYEEIVPISLEHQKLTLMHIKEITKTEYELQKIPEKLEALRQAVLKINKNT